MNLPIKFPTNVEVLDEEVSRFRSLSDENRIAALGEMFHVYHFLTDQSARSGEAAQIDQQEEELARDNLKEFVTRHG